MKIEEYSITVNYKGQQKKVPVKIEENGLFCKIIAMLGDTEINYVNTHNNGLTPICRTEDFDPELLFLIGSAIQRQRPTAVYHIQDATGMISPI